MIQLRRGGVVADQADVIHFRDHFRERQCVLLPNLLEPALLEVLRQRLDSCEWHDKVHKGVGVELVTQDVPALGVLHLLANSAKFLAAVREISACPDLNWFGGRVYRMVPNAGHYDSWHDDCFDPRRRVAMSLNLSPDGYEGGLLQLREKASRRMLAEIANTGLGNAILFRVANPFEHQVTEVTGQRSKVAFAGWFESGAEDFMSRLGADR